MPMPCRYDPPPGGDERWVLSIALSHTDFDAQLCMGSYPFSPQIFALTPGSTKRMKRLLQVPRDPDEGSQSRSTSRISALET